MSTQTVKTQIANNIMVAMSMYINQQIMAVLEQVIQQELIKVNMEEITTLPAERQDDISQRNQYIIKLFIIKERDLAQGTKTNYLSAVKRLITEVNSKSLDQMDSFDIDWYLQQYERRSEAARGKKLEPTTYNNERRFLASFYSWMRKSKLISDNPVDSIPAKKVPVKPIDYYSAEQLARLKDTCKNARERAIVEVFRSTGARVGEIAEITLDQIDWITGDILIRGEKGGKYRTIYLDDDARYYLKLYLDSRKCESPYMFPSSRKPHGKMTTSGFRSVFTALRKRSKLTCRVYPHKSRKTLGMTLKNRGVDIGTVSEVLGHADPAVTAKYYAQSTPRTLRAVRERI